MGARKQGGSVAGTAIRPGDLVVQCQRCGTLWPASQGACSVCPPNCRDRTTINGVGFSCAEPQGHAGDHQSDNVRWPNKGAAKSAQWTELHEIKPAPWDDGTFVVTIDGQLMGNVLAKEETDSVVNWLARGGLEDILKHFTPEGALEIIRAQAKQLKELREAISND